MRQRAPAPGPALRLLLVDDDDAFRAVMRTFVPSTAIVVGEACDGTEAIAEAARVEPDAILMDFHMPLVDGVAAALAIMSFLPSVRILLVSGEAEAAEAASEAGVGFAAKQALDAEAVTALLAS